MSANWPYAILSHDAKEGGGPLSYLTSMMTKSYNAGCADTNAAWLGKLKTASKIGLGLAIASVIGVGIGVIINENNKLKDEDTSVRSGDKNDSVRRLQKLLNARLAGRKGFRKLDVNGIFDLYTYHAVRAFQASMSLPVDGIVKTDTWKALHGKGAA